jgi:hypothetical protein
MEQQRLVNSMQLGLALCCLLHHRLGSSPVPRTEQLGPPSAQDTWELAAWKTSAHSLRRLTALQQQQQPQQQHSADDLAIRIDSGPLYGPLSISPHPGQTKVLTSHQLILQGTGASTSQQMMTTNKISLGVVIGAGAGCAFYFHAAFIKMAVP